MLFFGLAGMTFVLTQIYQFVLGYPPLSAGLRALPSAPAVTVTAPLGTRLAARFGVRAIVTGGLLVTAAGLGLFTLATGDSTYPHYLAAATLTSAGTGMTMATATQATMEALPPDKVGIGSAVGNVTRNLGTVLAAAVIVLLTAAVTARHLPARSRAAG